MTKVQQVLVLKNYIINDIENALNKIDSDINLIGDNDYWVSVWHEYMGEYTSVQVKLITKDGIVDFDDDEYSFEDIQVMHLADLYDTYLAS